MAMTAQEMFESKVTREVICRQCEGRGHWTGGYREITCSLCDGTGRRTVRIIAHDPSCSPCKGTGKVARSRWDGRRWVATTETCFGHGLGSGDS